jgi:hypothetical protein
MDEEDVENAVAGSPGISEALLIKSSSIARGKSEPLKKFLARVTHLNLNGKRITSMVSARTVYGRRSLLATRCRRRALRSAYICYVVPQTGLEHCVHLKVLYLFENNISTLEGLDACSMITHLYLQNNRLAAIENILHLNNLVKLYVALASKTRACVDVVCLGVLGQLPRRQPHPSCERPAGVHAAGGAAPCEPRHGVGV